MELYRRQDSDANYHLAMDICHTLYDRYPPLLGVPEEEAAAVGQLLHLFQ